VLDIRGRGGSAPARAHPQIVTLYPPGEQPGLGPAPWALQRGGTGRADLENENRGQKSGEPRGRNGYRAGRGPEPGPGKPATFMLSWTRRAKNSRARRRSRPAFSARDIKPARTPAEPGGGSSRTGSPAACRRRVATSHMSPWWARSRPRRHHEAPWAARRSRNNSRTPRRSGGRSGARSSTPVTVPSVMVIAMVARGFPRQSPSTRFRNRRMASGTSTASIAATRTARPARWPPLPPPRRRARRPSARW
jgi:hypothetical protein